MDVGRYLAMFGYFRPLRVGNSVYTPYTETAEVPTGRLSWGPSPGGRRRRRKPRARAGVADVQDPGEGSEAGCSSSR